MQFIHEPFDFPNLLDNTELSGKRTYITPEGNRYPSVTTILGAMSDNSAIEQWRNNIGHDKADRYTRQAANRGTQVHKIFEDFVGNCFDPGSYNPIQLELFNKSKKYLEEGLTKVHNLEFCAYSDILKTAGRCDILCEWNGITSILDYKTSKYHKQESWIRKYFLQETCYAMCLWEKHQIKIPQIVTFIVCEEEYKPQIFVRKTKDYMKEVLSTFKEYHQLNSI